MSDAPVHPPKQRYRVSGNNPARRPPPGIRIRDLIRRVMGEDVGNLVAEVVEDSRKGTMPGQVAKAMIERLVAPLATEPGPPRPLPTLPYVVDHRSMLLAMHEVTRLRREGEVSTAEARELKALVQMDYQAVLSYISAERARR